MQQNTDISNFELTDEDMATIATLDMGYSLFFDHYDAKNHPYVYGIEIK